MGWMPMTSNPQSLTSGALARLAGEERGARLPKASGGAARLLQQHEPYEAHHFGL